MHRLQNVMDAPSPDPRGLIDARRSSSPPLQLNSYKVQGYWANVLKLSDNCLWPAEFGNGVGEKELAPRGEFHAAHVDLDYHCVEMEKVLAGTSFGSESSQTWAMKVQQQQPNGTGGTPQNSLEISSALNSPAEKPPPSGRITSSSVNSPCPTLLLSDVRTITKERTQTSPGPPLPAAVPLGGEKRGALTWVELPCYANDRALSPPGRGERYESAGAPVPRIHTLAVGPRRKTGPGGKNPSQHPAQLVLAPQLAAWSPGGSPGQSRSARSSCYRRSRRLSAPVPLGQIEEAHGPCASSICSSDPTSHGRGPPAHGPILTNNGTLNELGSASALSQWMLNRRFFFNEGCLRPSAQVGEMLRYTVKVVGDVPDTKNTPDPRTSSPTKSTGGTPDRGSRNKSTPNGTSDRTSRKSTPATTPTHTTPVHAQAHDVDPRLSPGGVGTAPGTTPAHGSPAQGAPGTTPARLVKISRAAVMQIFGSQDLARLLYCSLNFDLLCKKQTVFGTMPGCLLLQLLTRMSVVSIEPKKLVSGGNIAATSGEVSRRVDFFKQIKSHFKVLGLCWSARGGIFEPLLDELTRCGAASLTSSSEESPPTSTKLAEMESNRAGVWEDLPVLCWPGSSGTVGEREGDSVEQDVGQTTAQESVPALLKGLSCLSNPGSNAISWNTSSNPSSNPTSSNMTSEIPTRNIYITSGAQTRTEPESSFISPEHARTCSRPPLPLPRCLALPRLAKDLTLRLVDSDKETEQHPDDSKVEFFLDMDISDCLGSSTGTTIKDCLGSSYSFGWTKGLTETCANTNQI